MPTSRRYFEQSGKSTKADLPMMLKTALLLTMTFGSYGLIMTGAFAPAAMWALTGVMGVGMAGVGFSVSHDALHGAYSANPRVNRALGFTFDLLGANGYMWKITHLYCFAADSLCYTELDLCEGLPAVPET